MKKILPMALTFVAIAVVAVVAAVAFGPSIRFRLQSTSPSGRLQVTGQQFKGQIPHALDGTLRLIVSNDRTDMKQQTSIPWNRNLAIKWVGNEETNTFVVTKNGSALIEFQVLDPDLRCVSGNEHLAADPYAKEPQNKPW
jgi:hypothetical protein